jgi:hypothetical protein
VLQVFWARGVTLHNGGAQGFVLVLVFKLVYAAAKRVHGWVGLMAGKVADTSNFSAACGSNDSERLFWDESHIGFLFCEHIIIWFSFG